MKHINFDSWVKHLEELLKGPLPGLAAQLAMFPGARRKGLPSAERLALAKRAGVLLLVFEKNMAPHFLLMKRVAYAGVHSAQISFPGGKEEKDDSDLSQTALRETEEEVGLLRSGIRSLGQLSPIYIEPSNFYVETTVAVSRSSDPQWIPSKDEVQYLIEVPFSELFNDSNKRNKTTVQTIYGEQEVPAYVFQDQVIWGATACILSEMEALLAC